MKTTSAPNGHVPTGVKTQPPLLDPSVPEEATARDAQLTPIAEPVAVPDQADSDHAPSEVPAKGQRRKGWILGALGVGAIAASTAGYQWWRYASTHQETDNATVAGQIHQVSTRIPGTVAQVAVADNQMVQAGDLLVQLDPRDYEVKVQQAQAALEAARRQAAVAQANIAVVATNATAQTTQAEGSINNAVASISTAQSAVEEAQAGVPVAQAQLAQVQATLQRTQADYNRYNALYQEGAVSRQQLETARAAYDVAVAQRNAAQQTIQQAQSRVAQARESVAKAQSQLQTSQGSLQQAGATGLQTNVNRGQYAAAQAAITQAQVALRDAELQLSYTQVKAPVAGRVGRKAVEVGQRVQPGTPLMAIVNTQAWIVANFKETQLEDVKPGQPVEIKLDAFPHHPFGGRVDSISPASGSQFALLPPDNATGNFTKVVQRIPVKITFDPQSLQGYESRITPGMSAEVSIEVK